MKSRHFDWTERDLDIRVEADDVRAIVGEDGMPVYEDTIAFYDPTLGRAVSGTVRYASGFFDDENDRMAYRFTVDLRD